MNNFMYLKGTLYPLNISPPTPPLRNDTKCQQRLTLDFSINVQSPIRRRLLGTVVRVFVLYSSQYVCRHLVLRHTLLARA